MAYGVGFGVYKMKHLERIYTGWKESFHDDGTLRSKKYLVDGKKMENATYYYKNGVVKAIGNFKSNLRNGIWQFNNKAGKTRKKNKVPEGKFKIPKKTLKSYVGTYQ